MSRHSKHRGAHKRRRSLGRIAERLFHESLSARASIPEPHSMSIRTMIKLGFMEDPNPRAPLIRRAVRLDRAFRRWLLAPRRGHPKRALPRTALARAVAQPQPPRAEARSSTRRSPSRTAGSLSAPMAAASRRSKAR